MSLSEIRLPEKLNHIGQLAFSECENLEYLYIPKSVRIKHPILYGKYPKLKLVISSESIYDFKRIHFSSNLNNYNELLNSDIEIDIY